IKASPFISGMFQSININSTSGCCFSCSSACRPSAASITSMPISRRIKPTMIRTVRESSTTRASMARFLCLAGTPEGGPGRPRKTSVLELRHQLLKVGRDLGELVGRALGVAGPLGGAARSLGDAGDVLGDLARALGGLRDVAADLAGGCRLFLDGAGDGVLEVV